MALDDVALSQSWRNGHACTDTVRHTYETETETKTKTATETETKTERERERERAREQERHIHTPTHIKNTHTRDLWRVQGP